LLHTGTKHVRFTIHDATSLHLQIPSTPNYTSAGHSQGHHNNTIRSGMVIYFFHFQVEFLIEGPKSPFKIDTISSNSGFWMILDPLGAPEYTSVVFDIF